MAIDIDIIKLLKLINKSYRYILKIDLISFSEQQLTNNKKIIHPKIINTRIIKEPVVKY